MTPEQVDTRRNERTIPNGSNPEKLVTEAQEVQRESGLKTAPGIVGKATASPVGQGRESGGQSDPAERLLPKIVGLDRVTTAAAEPEQSRQEKARIEEKDWIIRSGVLPTDRLKQDEESGENRLRDRLRASAQEDSPMDRSLSRLFSTTNPASFGSGKAKPLVDLVMQYTNKSREEVLNMANAALKIAQERRADLNRTRALEREINQLNPYAEQLINNNYLPTEAAGRLDELDKTGLREEKSLAVYKELQSLRVRKDNLSPEEKDRLKTLEHKAGSPGEDELRDTIQGLNRGVETYHQQRSRLEQQLSKYQNEKNSLEKLATGLSPDIKSKVTHLQDELNKSQKTRLSGYKQAIGTTIGEVIPPERANEFIAAYGVNRHKNDYCVTFSANSENGNLAAMVQISIVDSEANDMKQGIDIAANPNASLIIAGTEEVTLSSPGLKPFTGVEVDRLATLENLLNKNENTVDREREQSFDKITFPNLFTQRTMHLNVADGVPVDLTGLKQGAIQTYNDGEPRYAMDLRGAAQVMLGNRSNPQVPDFSLSVFDSGNSGKPTVFSLPSNNNLQADDIKFNEMDSTGKANKNLTMSLQGKIYVPLTGKADVENGDAVVFDDTPDAPDQSENVTNPVNIDIAVRPPYGTEEPMPIPVVRNGLPVDSPEKIAARVQAANIAMEQFKLTEIAANSPDRLLINSAYFRASDAVNGANRAIAHRDGGTMIMMMTEDQRAGAQKTLMKMQSGRPYWAVRFKDESGEHTLNLPKKLQVIGMDANRNPIGKPLLIEDAIK